MIRRANAEDAPAIYQLWRDLTASEVATVEGEMYPQPLSDAKAFDAWLPEYEAGLETAATLFLVDESAGKITGYVVGYINHRSFGIPRNYMEVAELYVDPSHRGPAGFRLIRAVTKAAKTVGLTHMECACLTSEAQTKQALRGGWKPYITRYRKEIR